MISPEESARQYHDYALLDEDRLSSRSHVADDDDIRSVVVEPFGEHRGLTGRNEERQAVLHLSALDVETVQALGDDGNGG